MLLNIVFSYNRAMQLDYLLNTILEHLKSIDFETVIFYHTTGKHKLGYEKLMLKYTTLPQIKFIERKKAIFDPTFLQTFRSKSNIKFFLDKSLKNKNSDLFKFQLENFLRKSKHELVMFNTDDGVFTSDVSLTENLLNIFQNNPKETSYRMYIGDNIEGFPDFVNKINNHYEWDYYAEQKITHWTYPFSVDGTIYDTKNLLKILRKIAYHNPITLEENTVKYVMRNKLLKNGLGPLNSKLTGTILNRVSEDSQNPTVDISVDFLNDKYLDGFQLDLLLDKESNHVNMVPLKITLKRIDENIIVYEIDEEGQKTQNLYGEGGSKK